MWPLILTGSNHRPNTMINGVSHINAVFRDEYRHFLFALSRIPQIGESGTATNKGLILNEIGTIHDRIARGVWVEFKRGSVGTAIYDVVVFLRWTDRIRDNDQIIMTWQLCSGYSIKMDLTDSCGNLPSLEKRLIPSTATSCGQTKIWMGGDYTTWSGNILKNGCLVIH